MEEQLYSGDLGKLEAAVEQAFWDTLIRAEGIRCSWQLGDELTETMFTVDENPQARITYPWNPAMPEAEVFFIESDSVSIFEGLEHEEVERRSRHFCSAIDRVWASASLQTTLAQRFAARMPQAWLTAIAQQAQQVVANTQQAVATASTTLADQLVQCVQEMVPGLAQEDFYVLARPLAVSMRGATDSIDAMLAQVPQVEWEQLSDVQRARLGLAIARFAIDELQSPQND